LNTSRTAIFRPGLGCTIVPPGTSEAAVRAQPFTPARAPAWTPRAWPLGDAPAQTSLPGPAQRALLQQHADALFAEAEDPGALRQNTIAFLVAQDGHLVYERYGAGYGQAQPQLGWSMTKSLTALLAGVLAGDAKVQLDLPVLQRFAGTPKQAITWRHLLHMASGLEWDEGYGGNSDVTRMLVSAADAGGYTADKPLVHEPGSHFNYSTGDATLAMLAMRELLGGSSQALFQTYQSRLFAPLGMRNAVVEQDASGTPIGGARGVLRPRDWLRLGQLVLDDGVWRGRRIVPSDFLAFIKTPSPAYDGYGGYVWLHKATPADLQPRLPTDLLWFAGHLGQYVVILPTQKLLVLRMGVSQDTTQTEHLLFSAVADLVDSLKQAKR
ncbi:MAG: class C beta-lactamase-related serine hydrolase, partial [Aquabacterium sp.]